MLDLTTPPSEPVTWHVWEQCVTHHGNQVVKYLEFLGEVEAKLWFEARALACIKYGLAPEQIEVAIA